MPKLLLVLTGLLIAAAPAQAHRRHIYRPTVAIQWQSGHHYHPRQPRIRLDEHCVWKPWKQKVVCKY